jgi:predicted transcriptional regulator of viral defense system
MKVKELSLYKIRDLALESGRAVYSAQQLSNLTGKSKAISSVYSSRLVKSGLATRLQKGTISFVKDDFVIATQLVEPSYISLNSALLFHGIVTQVPKNIECATPRNSIKHEEIGIVYHKISPSLFFGFQRIDKSGSYVLVAEPEKALIDGVYLNAYADRDVEELMPQMNTKKLRAMASRFRGRGYKRLLEAFQ